MLVKTMPCLFKTLLVKTMFVKAMFVKTMSCLSRICHIFETMSCLPWVFLNSTCFVNMFCQHATCFVNMFCQHVLPTCFANMFWKHALPTCLANMFCQHVLSTCFVNNFPSFITKISQTWKSKTTTKICIGLRCMRSQSKIVNLFRTWSAQFFNF